MPQDDFKSDRAGTTKRIELSLSEKDFIDLHLVRRRLYSSVHELDGQGQAMIAFLDFYAIHFILSTLDSILEGTE